MVLKAVKCEAQEKNKKQDHLHFPTVTVQAKQPNEKGKEVNRVKKLMVNIGNFPAKENRLPNLVMLPVYRNQRHLAMAAFAREFKYFIVHRAATRWTNIAACLPAFRFQRLYQAVTKGH